MDGYSAGWHRRRARRFSTHADSGTGTIRDQLLRSCQLHQGCTADDAVKERRSYYGTDGYKLVYLIQPTRSALTHFPAGHLGTPGLGMYCAAGWALEGFCDSIAYEIAPFNIKMTIVQPTIEIGVLTNKIISAPSMPQYSPDNNPAPLFRGILGGLLDRLDTVQQHGNHEPASLTGDQIRTLYPKLPPEMQSSLLAETINAITAIGGHDNPPARHIVGHEGVASVKEKLKTVSEELEDFVHCSCAVDIDDGHGIEDANGTMDGTI